MSDQAELHLVIPQCDAVRIGTKADGTLIIEQEWDHGEKAAIHIPVEMAHTLIEGLAKAAMVDLRECENHA